MAKQITSTPKRVEKAKEEVKSIPAQVTEKKHFAQEDGIICRSVVVGGLWYEGPKSHLPYNFVDYGDTTEIEYRDLVASVRSKSNFIFNPWFIIEDEDFIAEFPQLQKFYDEQYTVDDLQGVLDLNVKDMVATIKTLPQSAINTLKSIASTQVVNGQLDSVKKIKALDELFGTELNLMTSLIE